MSVVKQRHDGIGFGIALCVRICIAGERTGTEDRGRQYAGLLDRAPQTKAAMDALQEEFAPRQREFLAKQKEYEDLAAKVQKDFAVMGESERRNGRERPA